MGINNSADRPPSVSAVELHNKSTIGEKIRNIFNNNKEQDPKKNLEDLANLTPESVSKPTESIPETLNTPIQTEDNQQETDKKIVQIREQLGLSETKIKPDSELIKFKEDLGLDQVQIDKRKDNQSERLESSIKYKLNFKDNYHWSEDYISENNLKKLQERQELMKTIIDKMSPIEKLSKNIERIRVIKKLEKNGVPNAKNLIKSLEEIASPLILRTWGESQPRQIKAYISYNSCIETFKNINDFNQEEPINPDLFKRIITLDGYEKTYPLEISKYLKFNKLNKNQFDQFISLRSDYFMIINETPGLTNNLVEKITSGNFSDEDLRSQLSEKVRLDALGNFLVEKGCSFNYSEDLEISSQIIESFFINSSDKDQRFSNNEVLAYLETPEFKGLNHNDQKIILEMISLGIGVNSFYVRYNYHGENYTEQFLGWESDELLQSAKSIITAIHSPDREYLRSIIDFLDYRNPRVISILAQNPDFIKTEAGINLIKSIKSQTDYQYAVNNIAKTFTENKIKLTNECLQEYFIMDHSSSSTEISSLLLQTENFTNLSEKDKRFWTCVASTGYSSDAYYIQRFLVKNRDQFNLFFNQNNQFTSEFFEKYINIGDGVPSFYEGGFYQNTLTPELLKTFSPEDQKFWKGLMNIKGQSDLLIQQFIIQNLNQSKLFFDNNGQPTAVFFEKFIKEDNLSFGEDSPLRKLLTPEVLQSFDQEDQKLWNILINLKSNDSNLNQFIIKNKDHFNEFFNDNGQPTSVFFEQFIKNSLFFSDGSSLQKLLTPEVLQSFSPEDQKFWKFLLEKNFSLEDNKKIISNSTFNLIINNREQIAKDGNDIDFLNNIIGMFGKKSETVISDYFKILTSGVINKEDKPLVLEFLNEFSVLTPNIIKGYKEAKQNKTEKLFISNLKEISQKLTSSEGLSESEYQSPYYQDLVQHVYYNNSGNWASHESNNSCPDRSSDLSQFNIKDVYQIDLLSQSEIKIKEGQQIDTDIQTRLENPILQVLESLKTINFDQEIGNQQLHQQADKLLSNINLPDITLSELL